MSVTSPTQEAIVVRAADHPGAAIDARKDSKNRSYFDNCRNQGVFFQPLVVESFGGWDRDALTFLKELGRQGARRWGKDAALEIKFLVACTRLYKSLCRSVGRLVGRSVGWSVSFYFFCILSSLRVD